MTAAPLPTLQLKTTRRSRHPWIFSKMVAKPAERPKPGSIVDIVDESGAWVGRGFYNGHSRIALRVLTDNPDEAIDRAFLKRRIGAAVALRREVLKLDAVSNAWRVVHSEGDGLSGLIVDRYGDLLVVEYFSAGMFRLREAIRQVLLEFFPGARVHQTSDAHVQKQESFDHTPPPAPDPVEIREHGVRFLAAPGAGHKTGFFADQRDNRRRLADFTAGARVLDLCCNSGGFALYAKVLGGAAEVTGLDIDAGILAVAEQNARLNGAKLRFVQADLFHWLRDTPGVAFDVVVLDPAKLTRDREQVIPALKKYLDMNRLALSAVKPGGIFLTCSCTGLVDEASFLDMLRRAAFYSGREVQVLEVRGAGPDHPWLAQVPESRYLKAALCRVVC